MKKQTVIHGIFEEELLKLEDNSVDIVLTDPPYGYLKNQKWDKLFDEDLFFNECKRVLKKGGFLIFFGRGKSFHRWNTIVGEMKNEKGKDVFDFKEGISWDKGYCSSPLLAISRISEDFVIWSKGKAKINRSKVPYVKMREYDLERVIADINRLKSTYGNIKAFEEMEFFIKNKEFKTKDYNKFVDGFGISTPKNLARPHQAVSCLKQVVNGMNEKSIIEERRDHYNTIHPTQKPVKLLKRILNLVVKSENDVVLDPFAGSFSTGAACKELNLNFIGIEKNCLFFEAGKKRLEEHEVKPKELFR